MKVSVTTNQIRVNDPDADIGICHIDGENDFLAMGDAELVDYINQLHDNIAVTEADLPPNPITEIENASTLGELKQALTGTSRPEMSRKNGR